MVARGHRHAYIRTTVRHFMGAAGGKTLALSPRTEGRVLCVIESDIPPIFC